MTSEVNPSNKPYHEEYASSMKLIQDFFHGKTDSIKSTLLAEINTCIVSEKFEWAAKLRDIYHHIDQFTEKQTVIVDQPLSGIVAKIISVESKWVYVIIVFQHGKMVDVLRFSESKEELDKDQIIASIELEFWEVLPLLKNTQEWDIVFSKDMKVKQATWKELDRHFSNFITSFIASSSWQKDSLANDILKWLQQRYGLGFYPYRIEALDISHLSWGWASGWLSCMVSTILEKRGYRRYKIKAAKGGDDYDSLKECMTRRFAHIKAKKWNTEQETWNNSNWEIIIPDSKQFLPDLFIIDGGQKQLDVLVKLFNSWILTSDLLKSVQFVALGKGAARKSRSKIYGEKEILYVLDQGYWAVDDGKQASFEFTVNAFELSYDEIDKTLIKIRDEAHRFANSYRKKQMSMEIRK